MAGGHLSLTGARTVLFLPGHRLAALQDPSSNIADVWVLDFEDLVPRELKHEARCCVREFGEALEDRVIKPTFLRLSASDLSTDAQEELRIAEMFTGVVLPKVESPASVVDIAKWLRRENTTGGYGFGEDIIVTLETAVGVVKGFEILNSSDNVVATIFGPSDLSRSLDLLTSRSTEGLAFSRSHVALCARAAGVVSIDGGFGQDTDFEGLRRDCESARLLGYDAKLTVFPGHLPAIREQLSAGRSDERRR